MSNWNDVSFIQQGWQCPICGAVYSPMTMACMNCTGRKLTNNLDTSKIGVLKNSTIDWLHKDSVTKSENDEGKEI